MHITLQTPCSPQPQVGSSYPVRLGIIGGGQLARMTALAAAPLGVEVLVLEKNPLGPAVRLSPDSLVADWTDPVALDQFARRCAVVTLENEFVDAGVLERLEAAGHRVFPSAACLALTQDKFRQKQALEQAGVATATFRAVCSPAEVKQAGSLLGWPVLLKKRRNGYDGKGNFTVRSPDEAVAAWQALEGDQNELLVEAFYPFVKELAVIITRARDGQMVVYPVVETIQEHHVCRIVKAPAAVPEALAGAAAQLAQRAVAAVGGVGSFGVELFLSADGQLAINELAPRVHNSGHYTIEACACSQFENHVRAVLGWPLGSPVMRTPAAVMVNLLGTCPCSGQPLGLAEALAIPGAHVHLYGKEKSAAGRKMGHVTALGSAPEATLGLAERAARLIRFAGEL